MSTAEPAMSTADDGDAPAPGGPFADWSRVVVWWHVAFYVAVALVVLSLVTSSTPGRALVVQLACVAAIVVAYALLGARAARTREPVLTWAYLGILVAATIVAMAQGEIASLLLFVAFTHGWMLSERVRDGLVVTVALTVGTFLALWGATGWDPARLEDVVPPVAVTFAFAGGLGLFVARTMRQAEENARLVARLRAAQAELAATQHAAGVTAERERLAREIHDTLAQGFMSVVTQVQVASSALDRGDDAAARERLAIVEATARDNLAEARGLVAAFAPVSLQGGSLADALRRLAERWSAETGLRAVVEAADDVGPLAADEEVVLLRAAQEALTNVRRHAGASAVWLSLEGGGGAPVRLEVVDDGGGIPAATREGYGLRGMRDRVVAVGGALDVQAGDDGGTVLSVRLPARSAP
ncbi:histidine kinase [Xylanimonas cellulosilytica DSM 15894]|uniref:histidine kinase n=1 Tax=Xylanimonas cellulosilytica (strain DSM 15894 / JCM 12276 / CECT 5975 / KCTC 9989 / LMG 20990 / NBRC 107835 / XIL07) TaxID=446471 RepID=D1BWR4_XYLCX|nr:sensor histidine kinase [Xylanimonas cellulosilytica]ACZ29646.1 histidine kinase [Xylanimonas cellulosilytica DSM 15894]